MTLPFAEPETGVEAYIPIRNIPTPLQAHRGEILREMMESYKRSRLEREAFIAQARRELLAAGTPEDRTAPRLTDAA